MPLPSTDPAQIFPSAVPSPSQLVVAPAPSDPPFAEPDPRALVLSRGFRRFLMQRLSSFQRARRKGGQSCGAVEELDGGGLMTGGDRAGARKSGGYLVLGVGEHGRSGGARDLVGRRREMRYRVVG